jgi:pyruvate/2-oxoglutarate dehydrogenase complex dihydrolipoamide acyltransferase (E2) component
MAETRVTMPQLGESVHEGTISRWLVKPGDRVVEFEPMLEVDTDKVNAEVPAPVTGILKEIIAKEGETVQAGADIAVVELEAGTPAPAGGDGQQPAATQPTAEQAPATGAQKPVGVGAGDAMPSQEQADAADEKAAPPPETAPAPPAATVPAPSPTSPAPASPAPAATAGELGPEHRYSPAVQMLAADQRVDLAQIKGSGLGGRVTKKDVQRFIESGSRATPAAAAAPSLSPSPGDQAIPLSRVRKLIAENMTRSKTTIPHAWQTQEVDMSGVVANRAANKARFQEHEGFSLTYLPYVIAAAAAGLREHPQVNATFNETEIIVHGAINIGVSVGLEDTLIVPVIRNADGLSLTGIARAVNDLASRARSRQLKADDLAGATFTVNNSGTFGTLFSYSVINPGQAGILTMEAIVERPVALNGMIGIRPMMYLCFSFDHRVLDGLQAARFVTTSRKWLEAIDRETPIV